MGSRSRLCFRWSLEKPRGNECFMEFELELLPLSLFRS